jgi:hypothetical protein
MDMPMKAKSSSGRHIIVVALLCSFCLSVAGRANLIIVPYVAPSTIQVGGQYYEVSVSGLETYMDRLKITQPQVYQELLPDLNWLIVKRNSAFVIGGVSLTLGTVLTFGSLTFLSTTETQLLHSPVPNLSALFGGLAMMTIGSIAAIILYPGRSDFMNFMNKSNVLNPANEMRW